MKPQQRKSTHYLDVFEDNFRMEDYSKLQDSPPPLKSHSSTNKRPFPDQEEENSINRGNPQRGMFWASTNPPPSLPSKRLPSFATRPVQDLTDSFDQFAIRDGPKAPLAPPKKLSPPVPGIVAKKGPSKPPPAPVLVQEPVKVHEMTNDSIASNLAKDAEDGTKKNQGWRIFSKRIPKQEDSLVSKEDFENNADVTNNTTLSSIKKQDSSNRWRVFSKRAPKGQLTVTANQEEASLKDDQNMTDLSSNLGSYVKKTESSGRGWRVFSMRVPKNQLAMAASNREDEEQNEEQNGEQEQDHEETAEVVEGEPSKKQGGRFLRMSYRVKLAVSRKKASGTAALAIKMEDREINGSIVSEATPTPERPALPKKRNGVASMMLTSPLSDFAAQFKKLATPIKERIPKKANAQQDAADEPEYEDEDDEEEVRMGMSFFSELPSRLEINENAMYDPAQVVVLKIGESTMECGMACNDLSTAVIPSISGIVRENLVSTNLNSREDDSKFARYGREAAKNIGVLSVEWFLDSDKPEPNWERLGGAAKYAVESELRCASKRSVLYLPFHPKMSRDMRNKVIQSAFISCCPLAVMACNESEAAMAFASNGSTTATGMVMDIGESETRVVPIYQGETLHDNIRTTKAAGKAMTHRMLRSLRENKAWLRLEENAVGMEIARDAKEKHAFVSKRIGADLAAVQRNLTKFVVEYKLADGQSTELNHERFTCAEILFDPSSDVALHYHKAKSLPAVLVESLRSMDRELWPEYVANIVVMGGTANLPGLKERLEAELAKLLPESVSSYLNIVVIPDAGWRGAALRARETADDPESAGLWVTKEQWKSFGKGVVDLRFRGML